MKRRDKERERREREGCRDRDKERKREKRKMEICRMEGPWKVCGERRMIIACGDRGAVKGVRGEG